MLCTVQSILSRETDLQVWPPSTLQHHMIQWQYHEGVQRIVAVLVMVRDGMRTSEDTRLLRIKTLSLCPSTLYSDANSLVSRMQA